MVGKYQKGKHGLYIMRKEDIEIEAENILQNYCNDSLLKPQKIDIEYLIEIIGINLCYAKLSQNSNILGAFVFNEGMLETYDNDKYEYRVFKEKTIIIDSQIAEKNDVRLKFTYGHEFGHYVTQYDIFNTSKKQISLFDWNEEEKAVICKRENISFDSIPNNYKKLETKQDWQEWQANYFSSCILIPRITLKMALKDYMDNYDIMSQDCLLDKLEHYELKKIISSLANLYEVSNEMMENRLKSLKYLS